MNARDVIPPEGGLNLAFYGRHSTDKQDISMQLDAAERFCEKYHCTLVNNKSYHDIDVSATKVPMRGRRGLMTLLNDVQAGEIDMVVAYSESRLARDPVEHAQIRLAFEGVRVVLCDTETVYNPEKPDLLSQIIRDGASKFETDQTSERTRDGLISNVEHGKRIGGRLPFAFKYDQRTGVYYVPALHQNIIKTIFRLYAKGEGFSKIARQFGWQKTDGTWYKERVKSIIINPFYAGYLSMYKTKQHSRMSVREMQEWHYGRCDAIRPVVSFAEWLRCFQLYQSKQKNGLAPRHYSTSFLLTGLLFCSCDAPMKGRNTVKDVKDALGRVVKSYGSRLYICSKCGQTVGAREIHHTVITRFLEKTLMRSDSDRERLRSGISERLENELQTEREEQERLATEITHYEAMIHKAKRTLEPLVADQKSKPVLRVLEDYRAILAKKVEAHKSLQARSEGIERALCELKENEAKLIQATRLKLLDDTALRSLLLSLVVKISLTAMGDIHKIETWAGEM